MCVYLQKINIFTIIVDNRILKSYEHLKDKLHFQQLKKKNCLFIRSFVNFILQENL